MKVIDFPGAAEGTKKLKKSGFKREHLEESPKNKMLLGPIQYTCHHCMTITSIDTTNMIMKNMEFYCSDCGTLHKVSNPAFSNIPSTKPNPNKKIETK